MSNITNLNRDYLIKINVKEATIDVPKMTFWNTDKKTSNMFVQLVINMSENELIKNYVTIENATDYKITLNVIKPKTKQYKTIEATLLNEEKALFEIDLPDEFTDQVGDYSFEFEVSSKVDSNDESITTSNGIYKVNGSILTNLNEETSSSPDLPILKQLIEQVKSLQGGDLTGYQKKSDNSLETTSKEVVGAINEVNSQYKEIANLKNSTNVVDLKKYNITQADYTTPFTVENYNVAYQNGLGFQQAIDDAKEKNIQELIIPPGNYPLCYHANSKDEYNTIINSDGIDIIANDCKFYVIYDEEGINPYYSWTEDELTSNNNIKESYRLSGSIFNTNRDIIGAEIVGERVYRKNANTKYMDKSYGIGLTTYTKGNKIKNCKIHHISGDGIGCGKYMQQVATWLEGADVLATAKKFDYSSKTFVDSTLSFTSPRHSIYWADITKPFLIRGKNYFIWSIHPLKIHCFGGTKSGNTYTEGEYLSTILVNQGEYFYFPKDTCFFYVEIVDSAEHEISATNTISMALGYGTYCDTVIEGCEIYANQRGGISNIPTGTIIKNCTIRCNGGKYENMDAYYDGTQFGIDIEDVFIHSVTIDNCLFFENSNAILYRCHGIKILNSIIYGNVSSLNYAIDFYAENTRFKGNCNMNNGGASFGERIAIGCKFENKVADAIDIIQNSKEYKLPIASSDTLGGVMPITKAKSMTQPVGVDEKGLLYTEPTTSSTGTSESASWKLIKEITTDGTTGEVELSEDTEGNTLNLKEICIFAKLKSMNESNSASYMIIVNGVSAFIKAGAISNSAFDNYLTNLLIIGNYIKTQYGKGNSEGYDFSSNCNSFKKINISNINSIKISSNANFSSDSTIVIYGR